MATSFWGGGNDLDNRFLHHPGGHFITSEQNLFWTGVNKNNEVNNLIDSEKRQLFISGAKLLGNEKSGIVEQIGASYSLLDLFNLTKGLQRPIIETLTAHLRIKHEVPNEQYLPQPKFQQPDEDVRQIVKLLGELGGHFDRLQKKIPINFWKVDLRRVPFDPNSNFSYANFTNAWIGETSLAGVNMFEARFVETIFGGEVDFTNTDLRGADFRGADLRGTINLDRAKLKGAKYWDIEGQFKTHFPKGFDPEKYDMLLVSQVQDPPYRPK